jgi:hypothetical protein
MRPNRINIDTAANATERLYGNRSVKAICEVPDAM